MTNYLANISDNYKYRMLRLICQRGKQDPGFYAEYPAPRNVEEVNGRGYSFLKKTAEDSNIYLIWYNLPCHVYMLWGARECEVRDAIYRIRVRIMNVEIAGLRPPPLPLPLAFQAEAEPEWIRQIKENDRKRRIEAWEEQSAQYEQQRTREARGETD
jgi:hypothetical protein